MPVWLVRQFAAAIPAILAGEQLAALDLQVAGGSVHLDKDGYQQARRELEQAAGAGRHAQRQPARKAEPADLAAMGIAVTMAAGPDAPTIANLDAWLGNDGLGNEDPANKGAPQ